MIQHTKHTIKNGIKIVVNEDHNSNHIAVCYFIDAGSKYDEIGKSGSAHLLEHVLYTGTDRFPDYDDYLQVAGGDGNAFTNQDIACFYTLIPGQNFAPYLELEADRFTQSRINPQAVEIQKKVVIEEFKETCMTEPYGDLWHHIGELIYKCTSYEWPPIGKDLSSILNIGTKDLERFFKNYYVGERITIGISGPVDTSEVFQHLETLFDSLPGKGDLKSPQFPKVKTAKGEKEVKSNVPVDQLFMAFPGADRLNQSYLIDELLIEILGTEGSGFMDYVIRKSRIANELDIYHSEHLNEGLVLFEARPSASTPIHELGNQLQEELHRFIDTGLSQQDIGSAINRIESQIVFSKLNVLNKAMQLGYFGWLNRLDWMANELQMYQSITLKRLKERAFELFSNDLRFEIRYLA